MAYFRKRQGKKGIRWQAVIRKGSRRSQVATFRTKGEAEDWANGIELAISKGTYLPSHEARKRTVQDLLERYAFPLIPRTIQYIVVQGIGHMLDLADFDRPLGRAPTKPL